MAAAWQRSIVSTSPLSGSLTFTRNVPQGSILGPMLFSLYMNDLPEAIKSSRSSNIESCVDDKEIYLPFSTKDLDSCLRLVAEDLHHVAEWFCANHLLVNPDKTKLLLLGVRQLLSKMPVVSVPFLGQELTPVHVIWQGPRHHSWLKLDLKWTRLLTSLLPCIYLMSNK